MGVCVVSAMIYRTPEALVGRRRREICRQRAGAEPHVAVRGAGAS